MFLKSLLMYEMVLVYLFCVAVWCFCLFYMDYFFYLCKLFLLLNYLKIATMRHAIFAIEWLGKMAIVNRRRIIFYFSIYKHEKNFKLDVPVGIDGVDGKRASAIALV